MRVVKTVAELREVIAAARVGGEKIALVPTMGALHAGHLSLVELAKQHADFLVVSIFVNPLQFAAGEDFETYPRNLAADEAKLASAGVDVIFAPSADEVYADGREVTKFAGPIGDVLEGAARPKHFDGVLTVVAKLFDLVTPDVAVFGEKDAQQLFLIQQLAQRDYPHLQILAAPTVREASGLARSSRNANLSADQHETALALSAALRVAASVAKSPSATLQAAQTMMAKVPAAKLDYIALVDADRFEPVTDGFSGRAILLIAAVVGKTRLIDNLAITF